MAVPAPASKKPKLLEQNPHDESSSEEGEQFDAAEVRKAALRDEFKRVFKCWKKFRAELYHDGAWRKYFTEPGAPDEVARSSNPDNLRILLSNSFRPCSQENDKYDFDPQDDLIDQLNLDIGRIYRDLEKQTRFGFLPAMASCSTGQIGALMAERVFLRAHPQLRQAGGAPSPPQLQGGGVLDGGDSPHEPLLHGVHAQAREGL